jgi:predicted phosphoribosyltransferase
MFQDRESAAEQLATLFQGRTFTDPLVLAIPRGGVVTGAVLARALGAELDVVLARKLRAPDQPELAIGAVAESGTAYLDPRLGTPAGKLADYLAAEQAQQRAEIACRAALYRGARAARIAGRSVIVTDDGIATGATMIAALRELRTQHPRELIVAVPVAPPERLREVRRWCDEAVCLLTPDQFWAVGQFYRDFRTVEDRTAVALLRSSRLHPPAPLCRNSPDRDVDADNRLYFTRAAVGPRVN